MPSGIYKRATATSRFFKFIKNVNGCWEWQGNRLPQGYGLFWYKNKGHRANRVAWVLFRGKIPKGMFVCHRCDNPPCVNPEHLWLGSNRENQIDARNKGLLNPPKGENHPHAKLTKRDVWWIRSLAQSGTPPRLIIKKWHISAQTVCDIKANRTWKDLKREEVNVAN